MPGQMSLSSWLLPIDVDSACIEDVLGVGVATWVAHDQLVQPLLACDGTVAEWVASGLTATSDRVGTVHAEY